MLYSIIVVCLNAGNDLVNTVNSILGQTCKDFEIIIKDGGSTDGSLLKIQDKENIRIVYKKDKGIYDAMNQALAYIGGQYVMFMNCGDEFNDEWTLENIDKFIRDNANQHLYYGDIVYGEKRVLRRSIKNVTAYACYRTAICQQACIYDTALFNDKGYDLNYTVSADHEFLLYCFFKKNVKPCYMPVVVAYYKAGGFSESSSNRKINMVERKRMMRRYYPGLERLKYEALLIVSLKKLRIIIARSELIRMMYYKMS